jgi:hypothetical protein
LEHERIDLGGCREEPIAMITLFNGVGVIPGGTWDGDFVALGEAISDACKAESAIRGKTRLPAFSACSFKVDYRSDANALEMHPSVVLDADDADLAVLLGRIRSLGLSAIVYGTPSDDCSAPLRRLRVVIETDTAYLPNDCAGFRRALAAVLGLGAVHALNASCLFFVGRLEGTEPRYYELLPGKPVPVELLRALPQPTARGDSACLPERIDDPAVTAAQHAIVGALGSWQDWQGRKFDLCGAIGGVLRKSGFREAECAQVIRCFLPEAEPSVNVQAGVAWACRAWQTDADAVTGLKHLESIVGPRIAGAIGFACQLPTRAGAGAPREADAPSVVEYQYLRPYDLTKEPEPLDWICRGLGIALGKCSGWQGEPGAAKTPTLLALGIAVAHGLPFLGCATSRRPVLYISLEPSPTVVHKYHKLLRGYGLSLESVTDFHMCEADEFSDAAIEEYLRFCVDHGVRFIIIDTYTAGLGGDVRFNDASVRMWATRLARLLVPKGIAALLAVHAKKGSAGTLADISGHNALAGALQASIAILPDPDRKDHFTLKCARSPESPFAPITARFVDRAEDDALLLEVVTDAPKPEAKPEPKAVAVTTKLRMVYEAGQNIYSQMPVGLTCSRREVVALGGAGKAVGELAISRLVAAGLLTLRGGQYALVPGSDQLAVAQALGRTGDFQS